MNIAQRKAEMLVALRETLMPQLASTPFLQAFIDDFAACDITLPNPQAPRQNVVPTAIARYLPEMMETLSVQPLAQMFRSYVPHILWYEIFQGDATPAAFKQGLVAAQLLGGMVCSAPKLCIWVCFFWHLISPIRCINMLRQSCIMCFQGR